MTQTVLALFAFELVGLIILAYLLRSVYQMLRRDATQARDRVDTQSSAQMQASVNEMIAELRRTADQINQELLVRASTLQRLIDDAEKKSRQLESSARAPREDLTGVRGAAAYRAISNASTPRSTTRPAAASRSNVDPAVSRVAADAPAERPTRPDTAASKKPARVETPRSAASAGDFRPVDLADVGRSQVVRRLAAEGLDSLEIAKRTQIGREEVDLILGLGREGTS